MKKTIKFFAAALAIVAAASCAKEIANEETQNLVHKVFSASLNVDAETKTTLHTDGLTVHWTEGDKIALIPVGKTSASHFSINPKSIDGTFADFEGETVVATDYVGIYPSGLFNYAESSWDGSMIQYFKGNTLATQYANVGDFPTTDNGNANIAISTTAKDNHLYFKNVNAYFKFQLAFDNAAEIVISADAVSNDDPSTKNTSTALNLGTQLRYKNGYMYGSAGGNPITLKVDKNKTAFTKNATYYVAIPAVYVKGLKFEIKDANGAEIASFTKSEFTFEQNKIYNLGKIEKPKAKIGDYYYKDGTVGSQYNSNAVGVVFYVGDPHEIDSSLPDQWKTGLVVGLEEFSNLIFGTNSKGNTPGLHPDSYGVNTYASGKDQANSILDAASKDIMSISYAHAMTLKHRKQEGGSQLYSSYGLGSKTAYGSGWLIPSAKEYSLMYKNIDILNSKAGFTKLKVWTSSEKQQNDSSLGEWVIGYHTVWQANINGENGWRCLNYYYIDHSTEGVAQVVTNTNSQSGSKGHIGRAFFAF